MWAFGLQELQPSFPPSLGKDQVHPAAHSKQFNRGMPHSLGLSFYAGRKAIFHIGKKKNQALSLEAWFCVIYWEKRCMVLIMVAEASSHRRFEENF